MRTTRPAVPGLSLSLSLALILLGGCGGPTGPTVHPVAGRVLVDGQAAAKARVAFHALGGAPGPAPQPIATAEADGSFRPSTVNSGDGAPAGEYAVTVVWPRVTVDHGEEVDGPDRLRGRYADPATSGLKATIRAGDNALAPFELRTKP